MRDSSSFGTTEPQCCSAYPSPIFFRGSIRRQRATETLSIPSAISTRILDVNRLNIQITDRGKLITNLLGDGGGMWWFTETSREWVIYDQGPWIIGKINGMPTMGNAYWGTSYLPGGITDGRPALEVHPQDSVRFPSIQDHPHKRSIRS
jgi:hypothetical protein